MEKFSAAAHHHLGVIKGNLIHALHGTGDQRALQITLYTCLHATVKECGKIHLKQSVRFAQRLIDRWGNPPLEPPVMRAKLEELVEVIDGEMSDHLFLWVPPHRADFFGKKAVDIAGKLWCGRFKSTRQEIEEAAKCYAVGRYTASAFHMMRATESGTKALGSAIGMTPAHPGWRLVFEEIYAQFKKQKPRHAVWTTHEKSLVKVSGDLRTISGVWRNDLAHFVDTYFEDEAREMFTVIPMFMRHLSSMIDENGKLY